MTFDDEDAKKEFQSASSLLKVMVQDLEFEAAKHGCQVHYNSSNVIGAAVFVDGMKLKPLLHIIAVLNKKYLRRDKIFSFTVECLRDNAVIIVSSSRFDLEHLH